MKISVLGGTGDQGLGIVIRFIQAGENVIIGSRKAEKAQAAVEKVKELLEKDDIPNLSGMSNEDAADKGEILILTVPLAAQMGTLKSVKEYVNGKILIDATVPLDTVIGGGPARYVDLWQGSAAERTAEILDGEDVKVISAFNNISNSHLMNFNEEIDCDCLVSGDDLESKKIAMDLINKIPGIKCIDCGALEKARIVEKITPLLIGLNIKYRSHYGGIRITGLKLD
ncbi:NADPH-dependent F420 reductase [Methanobrevibacter sp. TMH8]|uniref:NADPH-dependent F420 reductase n=1 Tax=Methanobrevibacter sp. TMH8 TaxID=2848611 RepID=UPI001CCE99E7|nr:NADPH-dependent F420 reductase [Methanobrevibacter sp. TMH8]MBZ9570971.1 NADPH-dependent F420 reductase [Methanobrevibacter sp. TMH8]